MLIVIKIYAVVAGSALAAWGVLGDESRPVFTDSYNGAGEMDLNANLLERQDGVYGNAKYIDVTMLPKDAEHSQVRDTADLQEGKLSLTDVKMSGKGPLSIVLDKPFMVADGPYLLTLDLENAGTRWCGFKWTPKQTGSWPDQSYGVSFIITPSGTWTLWNNESTMKNVIGYGRVFPSDKYQIELAVSGDNKASFVSLAINGSLVVTEQPCSYPWDHAYLVLQSNGGNEANPALIDNLSVSMLADSNDPARRIKGGTDHEGIWIEGEDAAQTNFYSGKVVNVGRTGPSGGMFIRLHVGTGNERASSVPFYATYDVSAPVEGEYNLWIAATPQNAGWCSPLQWSVNGSSFQSLKGEQWFGSSWGIDRYKYAGWVFGWIYAGAVKLQSGKNELEIEVDEPRGKGDTYMACIDAIMLTTDKNFVPSGSHPKYSTQLSWEDRMAQMTENEFQDSLNRSMYYELISKTNENVDQDTSDMVSRKISARPFVTDSQRAPDITEFGLHGMERPFVQVGKNAESPEVGRAYELLARTGVDSFRTADSCWHRLAGVNASPDTALDLDFSDLDFQVKNAKRYGMTHLFTVGYAPASLNQAKHHLSACRKQFYPEYREYLKRLLERYKSGDIRYIELGNEVDAPTVWWKNSTPEQYVAEMEIVWEEVREFAPSVKTVAFGSTYARNETMGGDDGGRHFIAACMDLGIDRYADAYSLHHLAELKTKDFPAFFRRELERAGTPGKPLLDTEQHGQGPYPYDGAKAFARVFFLYDMPRMDFFLARDFYENGYLKAWGLFDIDWRPKLRLLAYAFSVDTMRGRELAGIATPVPGVEAYVLKYSPNYAGKPTNDKMSTRYAIVMWKNDRERLGLSGDATIAPVSVGGIESARYAMNWQLDEIVCESAEPEFLVGDAPIAVFTDSLPSWRLMTRDQYLSRIEAGDTAAPLPTSNN